MPKVTGGLFSLKATKSLKKTITFQGKKGQNIVYKYHKPGDKNPFTPSASQVTQRLAIKALVEEWQALSAGAKADWDTLAEEAGFIGTGYHYFMHKGGAGEAEEYYLLLETGDYILQENSDKIVL